MYNFQEKANFIWSIAELLRGDYKQSDYGKVILPLTVLRRLDCVLEPTKEKVLNQYESLQKTNIQNLEPILNKLTGEKFHNTSQYDFQKLKADPNNIASNLINYINGFSSNAYDIIEYFNFNDHINRLDDSNLLYLIVEKFSEIDLHPGKVSNIEMGYIFEELIRRFSEQSNETAGEHFTPREVIRLMVNLIFNEDYSDELVQKGIVRTLYDPACGTGGMLSIAQEYLLELNPDAQLKVFGQELNPESFAICKSDMLVKAQDPTNIKFGNSFTADGLPHQKFDYMLSNPPFGVEWKKVQKPIIDEHEKQGYAGRFGAGLPRVSDGSLLFLQHMISKMKSPDEGGSRIGIVFNGSPLFSGGAESGESNIRRWIIENDWLEAIVALPDQLFYNTGITTYVWIVTNRKNDDRKGKIQLINAVEYSKKMRKSLGNKRNEIIKHQIAEITKIHEEFKPGKYSKIFDNEDFGFQRITVERPLRLSIQVSEGRIEQLKDQTAFQNLAKSRKKGETGQLEMEEGKKQQEKIVGVLENLTSEKVYKDRGEFIKVLKIKFKQHDLKLNATVQKAIIAALSEKDETADICLDSKGNPETDADLRDYENVPLKENIHDYFEWEVKPHVSDAWIDEDKTKVGYEIPFTRYFYDYTPLRPLEEIDGEIKELESEILELLKKVTS
ncbi:SAM-dependent DNA methyltransferase [Salipaludibacillus agaradhaerens]|jgi:type I restriction enzyme M protein|uniref:type I restriction-modification system subunit M n=1 Tax=Salipaludibacillus agaradhaerens TaxID=76935 RepID=UPI00215071EB|nr:class I SAM-dependent DNA methyltransferase [Salipaludibacillus agaradhaerens]MCR6106875.1 SAM-dependent DNA methyltransferase [Salipaludibacillus agaradhaerens]MCR6118907.1 SAM-dependent DNA methyltransferase [Salipaludibacillus agaradhaerens]